MSNVPTWKRNLSKIEYIYQTYELAILIGKIVHNTPSKYRGTYGDMMIHNCERALYHGRTAQGFGRVTSHEIFFERERHHIELEAEIDNVATYSYIWFESMRNHDGLSKKEEDKLYKYENQIGDLCNAIIALTEGIRKSDRKVLSKL